MTLKSLVVQQRSSKALATQYTGQKDWGDDIQRCFYVERDQLAPVIRSAHFGFSKGEIVMGYQIRMGKFIPIKHGDWVVTPHGGQETFVLSDEEFNQRYIKE